MKAVVLYHPSSDHSRTVEDFARDFNKQKGSKLELVSLETVPGDEMAKLYDIQNYPAIIITQNDGQVVKDWQGLPLPLMDEVVSYSA
jgi:hypothetical protein